MRITSSTKVITKVVTGDNPNMGWFYLTYTYDDETVTKIKKLITYYVDYISWMTGITHNFILRRS